MKVKNKGINTLWRNFKTVKNCTERLVQKLIDQSATDYQKFIKPQLVITVFVTAFEVQQVINLNSYFYLISIYV